MPRITDHPTGAGDGAGDGASTSADRAPLDLRAELLRIGRRWSNAITRLIALSVELDDAGDWALDGAPTCAHWIASALDIEVSTAREWLRVGRSLRRLPGIRSAFASGAVSYTKVRSLTRLATPANEAELLTIAEHTPAGHLGRTLAAWSAANEDEHTRNDRHRRERGLRWRTEPDGAVTVTMRLMPEQAAVFCATVDAQVMRRTTPREPAATTDSDTDAPATRPRHRPWPSLGQQRVDALLEVLTSGGATTRTEVILHVRGDGCTLDDGTPIADHVVERIADDAALRVMIHDAERHPINVSGRHRHHTDRQKRVVKERDRTCIDCGGDALLEYDHVPDFEISKRTLVEETELRCATCHARRHGLSVS